MLLSRTLAKRRVARGVRPTFFAAWVPVLADMAVTCGILALITPPLLRFLDTTPLPDGGTIAILFVVYFVPFQAITIWASIWASMSRWQDTGSISDETR